MQRGENMRLIDADALIEKLRRDPLFELVEQYGISGVIDNAPTIDAVPVIRCKECKHSEPWYRDRRRCSMWDEEGDLVCVWDDGFCNYAEREKKQ